MNEIKIQNGNFGRSAFVIEDGHERLAEMEFSVKDGIMTVYHTEVASQLKGQGVASKLLEHMVQHARKNNLSVIPLCPFVSAQFKRDPKKYQDIWIRSENIH